MPQWLANLHLPAMSPHTDRTRDLSHWFISGKKRGVIGVKNGPKAKRREWLPGNAVPSTSCWCRQGWPHLSHCTDCWLMPSLLVVNCVKFHLTTFCFLQEKLGTNPGRGISGPLKVKVSIWRGKVHISLQSKYIYVRKVQMFVACVAGAGFLWWRKKSREEEKSEGKYSPCVACIW